MPNLISVKKTNIPNKYKVMLVDITYCLEHRVMINKPSKSNEAATSPSDVLSSHKGTSYQKLWE
jgi:hypothetical protein